MRRSPSGVSGAPGSERNRDFVAADIRAPGRRISRIQFFVEALGIRRSLGGPGAPNLVEREAVRNLETLDLLGRVRGVPAYEPGRLSELTGDVPEGRDPAANARDRRRLPVGADLDEVEDPVVLGLAAGRDRRPDDGRQQRLDRAQAAGSPLALEPGKRRELSLADQPVDDAHVGTVDADQKHPRRGRAPARTRDEPDEAQCRQPDPPRLHSVILRTVLTAA